VLQGLLPGSDARFYFVGGCNNGNGGGDDQAVLLGEHRQDPSDHIHAAFNVSEDIEGGLNNVIIDGQNLSGLTAGEIQFAKDAYLAGYIVIIYDVTEAQIEELLQLIDHPSKFDEGAVMSSLDDADSGEFYEVLTLERIGGVNWSSIAHIGNLEEAESVTGGFEPGTGLPDEEIRYQFHALHMKQWINQQKSRAQELVDDGLVLGADATAVINRFGLTERPDETSQTVTRSDQSGSVLDITTADIQTNYVYTGFTSNGTIGVSTSSADEVNTYQFTSKAWIVTADTPNGIFSFLFINEDYTLASSNGFLKNKEGSAAFSNAQQYWYLSNLTSVNTLAVGSTTLDNSEVTLLDNKPDTNQASTVSVTTSIDTSVSGTVGVDQDGANASVSGGVSWGTSETYEKANVSINNKSLSETTTGTDASWEYEPAAAEPGGQKAACNNLGLRGLADLSHETFTPSQAFVYRISPDYVGETIKLKTKISFQMRNTYSSGCNIFGCSCGKTDQNSSANGPWTFTHAIAVPEPPEGPSGDATCSDGIDNDNDGNTDSADNQC